MPSSPDKPTAIEAPEALLRAQKKANFLDTAIVLPIFNIKLGADSLFGLVPVMGDFLSLLLSLSIIRDARTLGVPALLRAQMIKNVVLDFALGCLPVLGDIADVFFRSNQKNVRIIEKWWVAKHHADIKSRGQAILSAWQQNVGE